MSYLQQVIDWIESEQFEYECDEDVNDTFERINKEWKPNNRFSITKLLNINNEIPDLMLYLQRQIDDECEDETEIITFGEDNLDDVREYIKSKIILRPENTANEEFEEISRILKDDNRPALDNILRNNKKEFLEFLESELSGARTESETDEEIEALESRVSELEPRITELSQGIADGLANLLGTPMRTIDSIVTPIVRTVEEVIIEPTSIIDKVSNFIRGLFK